MAEIWLGEGLQLVAAERQRQIGQELFDAEHDNNHDLGQLRIAAACYAVEGTHAEVINAGAPGSDDAWPWEACWDKRKKHDLKRRVTIAAALLVAELDRLLREEEGNALLDERCSDEVLRAAEATRAREEERINQAVAKLGDDAA